jgi:hypothetical protein
MLDDPILGIEYIRGALKEDNIIREIRVRSGEMRSRYFTGRLATSRCIYPTVL